MANEIAFFAQFIASKAGKDGLTPTWDVEQITRSSGARSALATAAATNITIGRRGLYGYFMAGADLTLYDYIATAITTDATVDQKEVAAVWTEWILPSVAQTGDVYTQTNDATNGLAAIKGYVDDIGVAGAGLTALGDTRLALLNALALVRTTIATLASQTSFTLTAGSTDNNAYVNCVCVVEDASTAAQKAVGIIGAYVGASKTVTLRADPGIFTMAPTDVVTILPFTAADVMKVMGTTQTAADVGANTAAILADTGTDGVVVATFTTAGKAEVQAEVDDALVAQKLDHLVAVADADDAVNNSIIAKLASKSATADWSTFVNTTDSLEANRDNIGTAGAGLTAVSVTNAVATTSVSAAQAASIATGALGIRTYHTFSQAITSTSTSALGTATKLWLAIKREHEDADAAAIMFIEATGGLTVLAGAAYATTTNGSLTVTGSSGAWTITAKLEEAVTGSLAPYIGESLVAELKALVSGDTVNVWDGTAAVSGGIVRAYA